MADKISALPPITLATLSEAAIIPATVAGATGSVTIADMRQLLGTSSHNMLQDVYTSALGQFVAGTTTTLTLSAQPGNANNIRLALTIAGVATPYTSDKFSLAGTTLTFATAIPVGTTRVEVTYLYTFAVNTVDSINASWTQSGSGAVTRTVRDKLRIIVNASDYGADPTGVLDSLAAINKTIVLANSVGGIAQLDPGTYKTTAAIDMLSNTVLQGFGAGSIIKPTSTAFQIINVPANTINWCVRDLAIQGAAATGVVVTHAGVYVRITSAGTSGSGLVENVTFLNAGNRGVSAAVKIESGNPYCIVSNCRVLGLYGLPASTGYGVLTTCDNTTIVNNTFAPPTGEGRNAVYLSGTATAGLRGIVVTGNRFIGFTNGCVSTNGGGNGLRDSTIANNTIMDYAPTDYTMSAIGIYGACANVAITGNAIDSTGTIGGGISIRGAADITTTNGQKYVTITGNVIRNPGAEGIAVYGLVGAGPYPSQYPSDVVVSNNVIINASTASPGTYSAIRVEQALNGVISNNRILGGTTLSLYGIALSPATPSQASGWNVTNNVITNVVAAAGAGISDSGLLTYLHGNTQDGVQLASSIIITPASAAATGAGLRVLSGVAPTTPVNGDVWRDGFGFKARLAGVTQNFVVVTPSVAITPAVANGAAYVQADINKIVTAVNACIAVLQGQGLTL